MRIFLSVLLSSLVLFFSCTSTQNDSDIIDYSELDELPTEVAFEIGESEDYLPGRITDVKVMQDGTILIGDMGNISVEQFDSEGRYVETIAEAGRGPGELSHIFTLHKLNGDTLIVRNLSGRKDYFAPTEGGGFEHINTTVQGNHTTRTLDILEPVSEDKFYAIKKQWHPKTLENPKAVWKESFVVVNEREKVLEDSVHVLKRRGKFSVESGGGYILSSFPFQIQEQAVTLEEGKYLVARPDSSAFFVYNADHVLERRIPVQVKERPVTEEDLAYVFDGRSDKAISRINSKRPDNKPPYKKVLASSNYFWLQTGESKDGKEVVVLDHNGEPVGQFRLPVNEYIHHVEDELVYTINSSPTRGNQVHAYNIEI